MSALAEEKGGKSANTPTLITPALVMSSMASALAAPAPATSAIARSDEQMVAFMVMSCVPFSRRWRVAAGFSFDFRTGFRWRASRQRLLPREARRYFRSCAQPRSRAEYHQAEDL